jgi:antitoxin ParD1/3/4
VPTRNVVLTQHQQELIELLVESGRYQNASEVLREGVRLVEQREVADAAKLKALQAAAQKGWDDIESGRYVDLHGTDELRAHLRGLGQEAGRRANAAK